MDKTSRHHRAVGVGGRLKQRLAHILDRSSCATTSATAFVGASTTNTPPIPAEQLRESPSNNKPNHDKCQRRSSERALVHISIDCSARSVGAAAILHSPMVPMPTKNAVRKSSRRRRRRSRNADINNKMRASSSRYGWYSSSSIDTDDGEHAATFSSDDDGEKRRQHGAAEADTTRSSTLFSSRSFSSDQSTSDFYGTAGGRASKSRRRPRHAPPPPRPAGTLLLSEIEKGTNYDKIKKVAAAANSSMAVVKRSYDPYADFRSSMVEMLAAGQCVPDADALAELLVWYLSLNSPRHHPVILSAFHDVWEAVVY